MDPSASPPIRVRLFGTFAVVDSSGAELTPRARKTRALLAYCVAAAPEAVSRERLAGLLWGDRAEEQARASLRQSLHELRRLRAGDRDLLKVEREQVGVDADLLASDTDLLRAAVQAGDVEQVIQLVGERPAEWLEDLGGITAELDDWLLTSRAQAREKRRQQLLVLARKALGDNGFDGARRLAMALLAADPADEPAAVIAIEASGGLGDRDCGHRLFVQLGQALQRELGVAPGAEAVASHARLLKGERKQAEGPPAAAATPTGQEGSASPAPAGRRRKASLAVVATLAIAALAWFRLTPGDAPSAHPTTAILPFEHPDGTREARILAATTASSIADALSKMGHDVSVPAITAQLQAGDVGERSRELGVPYIVRGEVRRVGDRMRVAVRLDDVRRGVTLLAESFERPVAQSSGLADEVAATAGAAIASTENLIRIDPEGASDTRNAARFLRQTVAIRQGNSMLAFEEASRMMAERPQSPLSQMALAMGTGFFLSEIAPAERPAALARARAAASQLRRQRPNFGDAYVPECLLSPGLWREACERRLRHALAVDVRAPSVDGFLSNLLVEAGRTREAAQLARRAFELRPFNPHRAAWYLYIMEMTGDETEVALITVRTDRYWPGRPQIAESAVIGRIARGGWREAHDYLRSHSAAFMFLDREQLVGLTGLAGTMASGRPDVSRLREFCRAADLPPLIIAAACLAGLTEVGDLDSAFGLANRYYPDLRGRDRGDEERMWLRSGTPPYETSILFAPVTRTMRSDPRFAALAERMRFPEYWRARGNPDFCKAEAVPVCVG